MAHTITLIPGDGIGPEVTDAAVKIIQAAGVHIHWERCEAGSAVFKKGLASGVPQETIDSIRKNKVALKGPLSTPVGYGEKSANVTLRKLFETYANIRPVKLFPGVPTPYSGRKLDFVIVRENVEDLYAGIEHMQTPSVAQTLKMITRKGCEKIVRLAFEFARSEGRKSLHCASKANIMKLSEGLLKRTFEEIAPEYPDIEAHHIIVDNCAHMLVKHPEQFDVIVTTNMNGDILSDLGSGLIGGLGFAPGANLGSQVSIFEAVHGSAPKYAGTNTINPTAVILSAVMMLRHIGEIDGANAIENAVFVTYEDGKFRTRDVMGEDGSCTTTAFTEAVIRNLGKTSPHWATRPYSRLVVPTRVTLPVPKKRDVVGVDVFVETTETADKLGEALARIVYGTKLTLKTIANRGVQVYPVVGGMVPDLVDCHACRFVNMDQGVTEDDILELLGLLKGRYSWSHIEKLHRFDGVMAYSKAQGED